jgi:HAD superfamily hydrolase (TIGR01509 family)
MIRLVCLDLDGVIFPSSCWQSFKSGLVELTGLDISEVDSVFHGDKMYAFKSGELSEEQFWAWANVELSTTKSVTEWTTEIRKHYWLDPKTLKFITQLKTDSIKLATITNNFPTRIRALDSETNFLGLLDYAVLSYQVGVQKPNPAIFQTLIDMSGLQPNQILYADDNEDKIKGAKDLGINCIISGNLKYLKTKLSELQHISNNLCC